MLFKNSQLNIEKLNLNYISKIFFLDGLDFSVYFHRRPQPLHLSAFTKAHAMESFGSPSATRPRVLTTRNDCRSKINGL